MQHLKIFLTFDYELPLGGIVKSYKHSLFDPTDQLLKIAEELKVPIVLFADILSALKFRQWDKENFYTPFLEQLHDAINKGHDVQLHLHPHWLHTTIEDGKFITSEKYALSDFALNEYPENIEGIVEAGCKELSAICRIANPDYACIAYRAGGYNLQPCTDKILTALYNNGIRYDSSISRGYFFRSDLSMVDYRKLVDKAQWILPLDGDLTKDSDKGILEIPIASKAKNFFELPTRFKLKRYQYRAVENRGRQMHTNDQIALKDKLIQLFSTRMLTVDNHTYSEKYLMSILTDHVNRYKNDDLVMCSLIGHPKSMGEYAYQLLRSFVAEVRAKYGSSVEFCTYAGIAKDTIIRNT